MQSCAISTVSRHFFDKHVRIDIGKFCSGTQFFSNAIESLELIIGGIINL